MRFAGVLSVLLACVACDSTTPTVEDPAVVSGGGSSAIDLVSARYNILNCVKNMTLGEGDTLAVPGVHSYGDVGNPAENLWTCTNLVEVDPTTIDTDGVSIDFDVAIQSEYVAPEGAVGESCSSEDPPPDYRTIDPRVASLSQVVRFVVNEPTTVSFDGGYTLSGLGAWHTDSYMSVSIASVPPGDFLETGAFGINVGGPSSTIPPVEASLDVDLAAGTEYSMTLLVYVNTAEDVRHPGERCRESVYNTDVDVSITGAASFDFVPGS